jgi:hypothetical protein
VLEDPLLQLVERWPGFEPELFDEPSAGRPERVEGIRLASRAIQREHQAREQALAQRVLRHEPLELRRELGSPAGGERRLDARFDGA